MPTYKVTPRRLDYAVYYEDEGRWTEAMTLAEARELVSEFPTGEIVSLRTAEIYG